MEEKDVNENDIIELTNGKLLIVKSYTKDGLMEKGECTCHEHCYLASVHKCTLLPLFGTHNLDANVIKNINQYSLYIGRCPLASGLCFKELEGGL